MSGVGHARAVVRVLARSLTLSRKNGYTFLDGTLRKDGMGAMAYLQSPHNNNANVRVLFPDPNVDNGLDWSTFYYITESEWAAIQPQYQDDEFEALATTADVQTSSTPAWTTLSELNRSLEANCPYCFEYIGTYSAAVATTGLVLTVDGPAFNTGDFWSNVEIRTTATASVAATITALNTAVTGTASILGQRLFFYIRGWINPRP